MEKRKPSEPSRYLVFTNYGTHWWIGKMSGCSLNKNFQTLVFVETLKIWEMFNPVMLSGHVINAKDLQSLYRSVIFPSRKPVDNKPFRVRLRLQSFYVIRRHRASNPHHQFDPVDVHPGQLLLGLDSGFVEFDWRFV